MASHGHDRWPESTVHFEQRMAEMEVIGDRPARDSSQARLDRRIAAIDARERCKVRKAVLAVAVGALLIATAVAGAVVIVVRHA